MVKNFKQLFEDNNGNGGLEFKKGYVKFYIDNVRSGIEFGLNYNQKYEEEQDVYTTLSVEETEELIEYLQEQIIKRKSDDFNI